MNYTKGPYHVAQTGNHQRLIVSEDGENIAVSYEAKNADLLASAPELYEACKKAVTFLNNYLAGYDNADADDLVEVLTKLIEKHEVTK